MALSKELVAAVTIAEENGWTEADLVTFLRAVHRTGLPVALVIALLESVAAQDSPGGPSAWGG